MARYEASVITVLGDVEDEDDIGCLDEFVETLGRLVEFTPYEVKVEDYDKHERELTKAYLEGLRERFKQNMDEQNGNVVEMFEALDTVINGLEWVITNASSK